MLQTLFVSYRAIAGFNPGLHKIGPVIVCCTGLTDHSKPEEFKEAIPRVREMITTGLYLPAIPRAVAYFGRQYQDQMKALIRELLPPDTQLVACECHRDEKRHFAMSHRLPITFVEECGGSLTMGQLVSQALGS